MERSENSNHIKAFCVKALEDARIKIPNLYRVIKFILQIVLFLCMTISLNWQHPLEYGIVLPSNYSFIVEEHGTKNLVLTAINCLVIVLSNNDPKAITNNLIIISGTHRNIWRILAHILPIDSKMKHYLPLEHSHSQDKSITHPTTEIEWHQSRSQYNSKHRFIAGCCRLFT